MAEGEGEKNSHMLTTALLWSVGAVGKIKESDKIYSLFHPIIILLVVLIWATEIIF